jgi:hypothetical protein
MTRGYEKIYSTILPKLAACDLAHNAPRLGAEMTSRGARLSMLGREYLITNDGVMPEDGLPDDVNNLSILVYYITSEGAGELSGEFAPLLRLTGMIDGQNNLTSDLMNSPLIREFGGDYAKFASAMARLGGEEEEPSGGKGAHAWRLLVLPKILSRVLYYEADEEFGADIQIMFDKVTPRFLDFECLAFLTGSMVRALIEVSHSV